MAADGAGEPSPPVLTRLAAKAAGLGLHRAARRLLARALTRDRGYAPAWQWLAALARDDGERRYCLEQAVRADPSGADRRDLRRLRRAESRPPPEVAQLAGPPPPPRDLVSGRAGRRRGRRRWWLAGAAGVVLAAVVLGVLHLVHEERKEPLYVALVAGFRNEAAHREKEVEAVRSHLDQVNEDGGVRGHPVRLVRYDDGAATDPATVRAVARRVVADGRVMMAIGHFDSESALAAGPVYAAAGVPLITPTATADGATAAPWVFRTTFDDSYQARFMAAYLRHVLKTRTATVVHDDSAYGRGMASGFTRAFAGLGQVRRDLSVGARFESAQQRARHVDAVVRTVRSDPDAGTIVLATEYEPAVPLVLALRSRGVRNPVMGGDGMSPDSLAHELAGQQERLRGGGLTQQVYMVSPQLGDSLTGPGATWAYAFRRRFGSSATWEAVAAQTAADAAVHALDRSGAGGGTASPGDRRAVRDALAAMDAPGRGFSGLYGEVHFDRSRSLRVQANVGVIERGEFVSAPLQLVAYRRDEGDLAQARAAGRIVDFDGQILARQQVVRTGFNFNRISDLDVHTREFKADFFLWFRYSGDDGATDVEFANQADARYRLPAPIRTTAEGGVRYRLYRVVTTFIAQLDFHDYPFDRQHLAVVLQSRSRTASRVLYVGDRALLSQGQSTLLHSGRDPGTSVNDLPDWRAQALSLHKDRVGSTATLGDPSTVRGGTETPGVHYNQYTADFTVARNAGAYLLTNLLPLVLLAIVTYATLLFSRDPGYAPAKVGILVTAVLTAVVLRTTMLDALPNVGYTVAMGWAYYAYFALAVACVCVVLAGAWLVEHSRLTAWRRLTVLARAGFPLYCAAVALAYLLVYG
ncbi:MULTISPECIES: ABC transporter substrate-binding protein [Streptomyces]|uniref:ABC transporter substrate-binding protein n=1 Tax=Streptomyces ramulosus TaxID=47762 RepID=A0ABW1FF95_9ACTN